MSILVYGSLVPDIVFSVPRLPVAGEDVPATSVSVMAAGGGGNVALALADWGYDVIAGGNTVGDDPLGRWVESELQARGISTPPDLVTPAGVTAANGILVTPDGERTIVGSDYDQVAWLPVDHWDGIDAVMVDGYSGAAGAEVIAQAADLGVVVVGSDRIGTETSRLSMLLLSATDHPDLHEAATIAATGPSVAVTDGPDPITVYRSDGSTIHLTPPPQVVRDSAGAGDVLAAAVTAGLADGLEEETALKRAADVAARFVAVGRDYTMPPLTRMDP